MPRRVRVLVVEDHAQARQGLTLLLEELGGVGEILATDRGDLAVRLTRELMPDLVLMDLWLPGMSGLEATRRIRELEPPVRVVAMSADGDLRAAALAAGAEEFIDKIDLGRRLAELVAEAAHR